MGFLTKPEIEYEIYKGNIKIECPENFPFLPEQQIQEASIDLRLSDEYKIMNTNKHSIDTKEIIESTNRKQLIDDLFGKTLKLGSEGYRLKPNATIFSTIHEKVTIPIHLVGFIYNRSWFARLGINISMSSPYCPPGILWNFPLQITNNSDREIIIYPYTSLAQILFSDVSGTPISYKGIFLNSESPDSKIGGNEISEELNAQHLTIQDNNE